MRITVCIKQVPEVADLRVDEERWTLLRDGVPSRINPYDLQALEMALLLRERHGGDILALTMGPPQSEEVIREAMAMGADFGLLLTDPALAGADTLATSTVLAQAIRKQDRQSDVVLCGARSTDSDTGQVGPQLAEDLGIPHVAYSIEIEGGGQTLRVQRRVDRYHEIVRLRLPALVTVLQSPITPRDIPFGWIETAFREKQVVRWGIEELGLDLQQVGFKGSATWVRMIREPQLTRRASLLHGSPREAVEAIIQALVERYILDR